MPVIPPADLVTLRSQRPHTARVDLYMAVAPYGVPCFTARVNQPGWVDERGQMTITYDGDVGEASVVPGMTLWVGSSVGDNDKGSIRIRSINVGANTIGVAENDHIEWSDDDHICCPGEAGFFEIWGKFPRITESGGTVTFYKDYDYVYNDPVNDVIAPKANAGPPVCAWITGGVADVSFTGDRSFTTEVGAAIASYQWDWADGVQIVGVSTDAGTCAVPNVVRFTTPGFRYVSLTVTDNTAQARTGTVYVPVWIFQEGVQDPYDLLEVRSLEGSADEPWRLTVRVFQTDTTAEDIIYRFPDGALVVLFSRTWYAGVEDAIGGFCYRENIRFVGWLDVETLTFDDAAGAVDFEAVASDRVLDWIPGFAYTVEDVDNADDWYEVINLNVDRAAMELLELHTTANWVCHLELPGEGSGRPIMIQQYPKTSIYDQLQAHLFVDAKCLLRCDRQGVLRATRDPQFMSAADRAGVTIYCDLVQGDWMNDIDAETDEQDRLGHVKIGGFAYDQPHLSQAPGDCPTQVSDSFDLEGHIFIDQTEANLWSGLYFTRANIPYPDVPLALCGDWPVFDPADQQYIRLTTTDPLGRINWSNEVFVVRSVKHEFGSGTCVTRLGVEIENPILTGETIEIPEPDTPSPKVDPWPGPPAWGGDLTHVILRTSQGIIYTESFDDPNPKWLAGNSGLSTTQRQDVRDMAFDFKHGARLYICIEDASVGGAFRCNDIWDADTWTQQYTSAQARSLITTCPCLTCYDVDINWSTYDGLWAAVWCDPVDGSVFLIGGAHDGSRQGCNGHKRAWFSEDALASLTLGDTFEHDPSMGNCGNNHCATPYPGNITSAEGHQLFTYNCAWAFGGDSHRGWSTSKGTVVDTSVGQVAAWSGQPLWHARAGAEVMYWVPRAGIFDIWKSGDHGINWAAVGGGGTLPRRVYDAINALAMHHLNTSNLMYIDDLNDLRVSTDGGSTWSAVITGFTTCTAVVPAMIEGNPEGKGFVVANTIPAVGSNNWIWATPDLGTTWWNKSGDIEKWLTPGGGGDTIYQIICVQSRKVT